MTLLLYCAMPSVGVAINTCRGELAFMATSAVPITIRERLETLCEMCQLLAKQLASGSGSGESEHTNDLDEFFKQLLSSSKSVSDSCTKLSLLFSRPPCPSVDECGSLCAMVEQRVMGLVSNYRRLAQSSGQCLVKEVVTTVRTIIGGVEHLAKVIASEGCVSDCQSRLQGTGSVWEACASAANVSRDNRAASLKLFISQLHLLHDASAELDKLVECKGGCVDAMVGLDELAGQLSLGDKEIAKENEASPDAESEKVDVWSREEMPLVDACVQLIKIATDIAAKLCRTVVSHATASTEEHIEELDTAAEITQRLSPFVDDLVCELEAPVDIAELNLNGARLKQLLLEILERFSAFHFCKLAGSAWNIEEQKQSLVLINI